MDNTSIPLVEKELQQNPWSAVLSALRNQLNEQSFRTWLTPTRGFFADPQTLIVETPNPFTREWIIDHYATLILQTARNIHQNPQLQIRYSINPATTEEVVEPVPVTQPTAPPVGGAGRVAPTLGEIQPVRTRPPLNPKYTFESFVVGPSNRFAHAAALAVAESPAKAYNPLFIYGGVGLGKTHLMQAIGRFLVEQNPDCRILYVSSEQFTNQLIQAIQTRTTAKFREKYRTGDALLIDDIQFIAGKESTQEEFFHTFNALYDSHKQIVVTSDRSPKDIPMLEERLVSRFAWGLVTDIQPPDIETRIAILRNKAERESCFVPDEVIGFVAENFKLNIRELEGALIRVVASSSLMNQPVSLMLAKDVLKDLLVESQKKLSIEHIQESVADYFQIRPSDFKTKKRTKSIVFPRQIAMFLCRELTGHSLPEIGSFFGGRDHTTVLYACAKIQKEIKIKETTRKIVNHLLSLLKRE